jgi:hypothetical protein
MGPPARRVVGRLMGTAAARSQEPDPMPEFVADGGEREYQFLFLVSQAPRFALKVMRVLAHRLRSANSAIA